ncbi:MAG: nucleoside phosphorylase [Bacteroidota bacterium]
MIKASELVLNPDKSVYHLKLHPEQIADTILLVGDPGRVAGISALFSKIEFKQQNREIVTHTGTYNNKRITAMSTGMGTDNIDIVVNELDVLANFDIQARKPKDKLKSLTLIRMGTSGAIQKDIPVGSFVVSEFGVGLDGMLNFYDVPKGFFHDAMSEEFIKHCKWSNKLPFPYIAQANTELFNLLSKGNISGVTATAPGFYGPQGRELRLKTSNPELNSLIETFSFDNKRITNIEMETSALYGLSGLLGHKACTICTIIANRVTKEFCNDYHPHVQRMVETVLDRITKSL